MGGGGGVGTLNTVLLKRQVRELEAAEGVPRTGRAHC